MMREVEENFSLNPHVVGRFFRAEMYIGETNKIMS